MRVVLISLVVAMIVLSFILLLVGILISILITLQSCSKRQDKLDFIKFQGSEFMPWQSSVLTNEFHM